MVCIATVSLELYNCRRANARMVIIVLQIDWIMRKNAVNNTDSDFCGNNSKEDIESQEQPYGAGGLFTTRVRQQKTQMFRISSVMIGNITSSTKYSG
ncbi:hypothetical protein DPMN_186703 [Dreissena polymorpha]|uniref:Uncharacterized protein n=1 Tax=Dreissena polymorpha TaxID=45954 RepID=A0A9D4I9L5_DREPO|nr:hypothetical protein DPMN_186703 [Dreissena polymorpha]